MAIKLTFRRTRRLSMRVAKNGDIHISAPYFTRRKTIEAFIERNQEWLTKALQKNALRQEQRAAFYSQLPLSTKAEKDEATERIKALVEPMVEEYSEKMSVRPTSISFKPTISRWGICSVKDGRICFSTYLLLLPEWCIRHVVVHELCHLLEPSHNARFYALMDEYYPLWREARKETRRVAKG